ncbi:hypothetical protein OIU84_005831 [Salix udensis]|uniref:VHS domain-containing protein n=1 Tax=Salix udensis TaxID=889485 RepID=A0AAD6P155_9ROSI|nr:hypothetical protein OIU84_005831 [Salix udensis]
MLDEPDWAMNLEICDIINHEKVSSVELIRGIKKRIVIKNARGESTSELHYLPVYEETYKSLKSRGIRFPGRDNDSLVPIFTPPRSVSAPEVDASLTHQIQASHNNVVLFTSSRCITDLLVAAEMDPHTLLFEGLNVNDEIQKVLSKYEELKTPSLVPAVPEPALIPVAVEPDSPIHAKEDALIRKPAGQQGGTPGGSNDDLMDDLDEMIFGKKGGSASEGAQDPKKDQLSKDDLITF